MPVCLSVVIAGGDAGKMSFTAAFQRSRRNLSQICDNSRLTPDRTDNIMPCSGFYRIFAAVLFRSGSAGAGSLLSDSRAGEGIVRLLIRQKHTAAQTKF